MFFLILAVIVVWGMYAIYQKNFDQPVLTQTQTDSMNSESPSEISSETEAPFEKNVQIEILNGCGVNGIAKVFQSYLREHGFDVVNTENYVEEGKIRWDLPDSKIIYQTSDVKQAEELARILHIPANRIIYKDDPNAIYDLSIVIGRDYKKLLGVD